MLHAFVCETQKWGGAIIQKMSPFYFNLSSNPYHRDISVLCKWSGRVDTIRIITTESQIHGYRFDGQLILSEDNNFTYGLHMYLTHNRKPISRCTGAEDEETLFWHWATEDTFGRSASDDRDVFKACMRSVDPKDYRWR